MKSEDIQKAATLLSKRNMLKIRVEALQKKLSRPVGELVPIRESAPSIGLIVLNETTARIVMVLAIRDGTDQLTDIEQQLTDIGIEV